MNRASAPMNTFLHDLLRDTSSKSFELVSDNARSISPAPTSSSRRNSRSDDDEWSIPEDFSVCTVRRTSFSEPDLVSMRSYHPEFDFGQTDYNATPDGRSRRRRNSDPTRMETTGRAGTPRLQTKTLTRPSPLKSKGLFCPGIENLSTDNKNRMRPLLSALPPNDLSH